MSEVPLYTCRCLTLNRSVFASLVGSYHSLFNDGHDDAPHLEHERVPTPHVSYRGTSLIRNNLPP